MKKILFYPGTFNPPHFGHIQAVIEALKVVSFDEVWIMPSGKRVDKEITTSLEDRKNLSNIFVKYLQKIIEIPIRLIDDAVLETNNKYTHELIVELKSKDGYEIYQLVGIDGYISIKERVISPNEKFIIIKRPGYEFPESITSNENLIILEEVGRISSTIIRDMVRRGDKEYTKLIPEEVAEYINQSGLYI